MTTLKHIFRHPIKSIGRQAVTGVAITPGQALPWDRQWAVAHTNAALEDGWSHCRNFLRAASSPALMAITAGLDQTAGQITLSHPGQDDLTFAPDDSTQHQVFLDWVNPLVAENLPLGDQVVALPQRGMTDTSFTSISLNNLASLDALSEKAGQALSPHRFRGNFWVDGLDAFEEHGWVGRHIQIGTATFEVKKPIDRCTATMSNPDTGARDVDTLQHLRTHWGHIDFGIYLSALTPGEVAVGDKVTLL
ncbi:MAG: MOSC domain-containing protein [Planktomarina sp.]